MLPNGNTYLSDFWANETFDIQKAVSLWYLKEKIVRIIRIMPIAPACDG